MNTIEDSDKSIVVYWVAINVRYKRDEPTIKEYLWDNMPAIVRSKWDWYFTYRAALLQVQYPKGIVDFRWGSRVPDNPNAIKLALERKIRAKKAKITEMKNKVAKAEQAYKDYMVDFRKKNEELLIKESEPEPLVETDGYKYAMSKIKTLQEQLKSLIEEHDKL